jgi:flagellar hook-basal body complex protein FliE
MAMNPSMLAIEGLQPRIGAVESQLSQGAGVAGEARVAREMTAQGLSAPAGDAKQAATTFSDILRKSVEEVNLHQHQADQAIKELVAGRTKNIHETMLAVERADTSLKLAMQVRNKVLDAYREIMRMQV